MLPNRLGVFTLFLLALFSSLTTRAVYRRLNWFRGSVRLNAEKRNEVIQEADERLEPAGASMAIIGLVAGIAIGLAGAAVLKMK